MDIQRKGNARNVMKKIGTARVRQSQLPVSRLRQNAPSGHTKRRAERKSTIATAARLQHLPP
jgi:hypothetical protein